LHVQLQVFFSGNAAEAAVEVAEVYIECLSAE
jgi:hypothetical protein